MEESILTPEIRHKPKEYLLDEKVAQVGYKIGHFRYFFMSFLLIGVEGAHVPLMGLMVIPITKLYSLSTLSVQITSAFIFLGIALGSLTLGLWTNTLGRKFTVNFSNIAIVLMHLIFTLCEDFFFFVSTRIIIGYFIGLIVPISLNVLCEVLPVKYRAFILTAVWTGIASSMSLTVGAMLYYMPNLEPTGIKAVYLVLFYFLLGAAVLVLIFFTDSPRNLILSKEEGKGFTLLEDLLDIEIPKAEREIISNEIKSEFGERKSSMQEFLSLFSRKYRTNVILLTIIWILVSFTLYGPILIISVSLNDLNKYSDSKIGILLTIVLFGILAMTGNLIGGFLTEIKILGRRITMIISFLCAIIFNVLLLAYSDKFDIFIGMVAFFLGMGNNITNAYATEIFPTSIRDIAMGFLFFNTRIGGFVSQFVFYGLYKLNVLLPYYVMLGLLVSKVILIMFLPNETCGQPIDKKYKERNIFTILFGHEEEQQGLLLEKSNS